MEIRIMESLMEKQEERRIKVVFWGNCVKIDLFVKKISFTYFSMLFCIDAIGRIERFTGN